MYGTVCTRVPASSLSGEGTHALSRFGLPPPPKGYDIILLISIKIPTTNTKGLPGYCRLYHMIDAGRTVLPGLDVYWWGVFCFLTFCWCTGMRDDAWFIGGDNDDGDIRIGATFFSPPFNVVRGCPESFLIFAMRAASCCCSSFLLSSSSLAYLLCLLPTFVLAPPSSSHPLSKS